MWSEYDEPLRVEMCERDGIDPYPEETRKREHEELKIAYAELLEKYNKLAAEHKNCGGNSGIFSWLNIENWRS